MRIYFDERMKYRMCKNFLYKSPPKEKNNDLTKQCHVKRIAVTVRFDTVLLILIPKRGVYLHHFTR